MGGISRRNFNMFRKLCGDETLKNVLIVTTMWGAVDPGIGEAREKELMTNELLFKPVLDKGASMLRHDNTPGRAQDIVRNVMRNHPQPLCIQRELVEEGKSITETAAGEALGRELAELAKKHRQELEQVQKEMREALEQRDFETKKELEEYQKKVEAEAARAETDMSRLRSEYAKEKRQADEYLKKLNDKLDLEQQERLKGQKLLENLQAELQRNAREAEKAQAQLRGQIEGLKHRGGGGGGFCIIM